MQDSYTTIVNLPRMTRKVMENESRLYDKECPKCGLPGMIFLWDVKQRKYTTSRCASNSCKHGN